jgi:hypothetical protein
MRSGTMHCETTCVASNIVEELKHIAGCGIFAELRERINKILESIIFFAEKLASQGAEVRFRVALMCSKLNGKVDCAARFGTWETPWTNRLRCRVQMGVYVMWINSMHSPINPINDIVGMGRGDFNRIWRRWVAMSPSMMSRWIGP